jgi:hypothetical protein
VWSIWVRMNQDDIFCVICRQAIDLDNFKQDEHGLAVHDHRYVSKMQSFPTKNDGPRSNDRSDANRVKSPKSTVPPCAR